MNLIIGVVGDNSLHRYWKDDETHDLFLVYYGDNTDKKEKYKREAKYYEEYKGTKFNIVSKLYLEHKEIIDKYEYIFVPDDDLFLYPNDINRLFEIAKEHKIVLLQPAIIGYYSIPITLPTPCNKFRYTNYVEIMCPCFHIKTFKKLHCTFNYNKSCWGIDLLWNLELGRPKNKIAIIDDVVALHTRPVYGGDNYLNNNINNSYNDVMEICNKFKISKETIVYKYICKPQYECEKKRYIYPNNKKIIEMCNKIRGIVTI